MSAAILRDPDKVDDLVASYAALRTGQRGIEAYLWFVSTLRRTAGSESVAVIGSATSGILTFAAGAAVLHSLQGDLERGADVISAARAHAGSMTFRGLALPGDRLTKNLFEEARLPAQMLLH